MFTDWSGHSGAYTRDLSSRGNHSLCPILVRAFEFDTSSARSSRASSTSSQRRNRSLHSDSCSPAHGPYVLGLRPCPPGSPKSVATEYTITLPRNRARRGRCPGVSQRNSQGTESSTFPDAQKPPHNARVPCS